MGDCISGWPLSGHYGRVTKQQCVAAGKFLSLPGSQYLLVDHPLDQPLIPGGNRRVNIAYAEAMTAGRVDVHLGGNALFLQP